MEFVRGNLAVRDHAKNNKTLFLFEAQGKGKGCRFIGEYSCSNFEYRRAPARNGADRQVIVFHLLAAEDDAVEAGSLEAEGAVASKATLDDLRARAYSALSASEGRAGREARRTLYVRRAAVKDYVLARAAGQCECCLRAAPFIRKDGTPYLEPHHVTRLSDAGLDHPAHVAAVCPTCHREIHYGQEGDSKNAELSRRLAELETTAILMAPQSRLVHVVAAVIEHQGRYLLALRAAGRSLAGYWEFPGGKVEAGEDPRVALARELEEELAATDVRVGAALGERPHEYGNLTVLIDAYQVACHIGSLRPLEHERIEWFSLQQMRGIQLAPADEFLVPLLAARSDV